MASRRRRRALSTELSPSGDTNACQALTSLPTRVPGDVGPIPNSLSHESNAVARPGLVLRLSSPPGPLASRRRRCCVSYRRWTRAAREERGSARAHQASVQHRGECLRATVTTDEACDAHVGAAALVYYFIAPLTPLATYDEPAASTQLWSPGTYLRRCMLVATRSARARRPSRRPIIRHVHAGKRL